MVIILSFSTQVTQQMLLQYIYFFSLASLKLSPIRTCLIRFEENQCRSLHAISILSKKQKKGTVSVFYQELDKNIMGKNITFPLVLSL